MSGSDGEKAELLERCQELVDRIESLEADAAAHDVAMGLLLEELKSQEHLKPSAAVVLKVAVSKHGKQGKEGEEGGVTADGAEAEAEMSGDDDGQARDSREAELEARLAGLEDALALAKKENDEMQEHLTGVLESASKMHEEANAA